MTPIETPIPIRRQLIIIQAESLDFNILGYHAFGHEVTPFLNGLRERSLFYRIAAARYNGSADVDFVMLNGVMPSMHITTYNIPNYPYDDALPQFLARFGCPTSVFHGNTGNFYNRRAAFDRMHFAHVHFKEEMVEQAGLPLGVWGVEDRHVLDYSTRLLQPIEGPVCHFIITLTTHTPYTLLGGREREIVADPQTMAQHYLNNMRYLDNQLRDYIAALGSATVVIYSDHPADPAVAPEFVTDCEETREFVPCFIHDTEIDLGLLQQSRGRGLAESGRLSLLDISNYLRARIAAAHDGQPRSCGEESGLWRLVSEK